MRVAVIGKGNVGKALAPNIAAAGYDVVYGVRNPRDPKYANDDGVPLKTVGEAVSNAEIVILAINWGAVDSVLSECGAMNGKVLVDCINPYDFRNNLAPLVAADQSAARLIAGKTAAKVVKAFNQVGAAVMARAPDWRTKPLQFVAADDEDARCRRSRLCARTGGNGAALDRASLLARNGACDGLASIDRIILRACAGTAISRPQRRFR